MDIIIDIVKTLILPSNFSFLLLWLGLALLVLSRFKRSATAMVLASAVIMSTFSSGIIASLLNAPLEYSYPVSVNTADQCDIKRIVVLNNYAVDDAEMPLSSRVSASSAYRLLEASHLLHDCPDRQIFISGSGDAEILKAVLVGIGLRDEQIFIDNDSPHTNASAENLQQHLQDTPFYLVTSAGHMPRAFGVFQKLGLNPIAAPTDFSMPKNPLNASLSLSPLHLQYSDRAVNEYAGLTWYYLSGKI